MDGYLMSAVERAIKVQAVILKAMSGQLQWWQAAEILGVSCRPMRRGKLQYERHGYDGLFDRRRRRPSPKRVPVATVARVLRRYREQYQGWQRHPLLGARARPPRPPAQLPVGQDRPANRRAGRPARPARPASPTARVAAVAGDDALRGRQHPRVAAGVGPGAV